MHIDVGCEMPRGSLGRLRPIIAVNDCLNAIMDLIELGVKGDQTPSGTEASLIFAFMSQPKVTGGSIRLECASWERCRTTSRNS